VLSVHTVVSRFNQDRFRAIYDGLQSLEPDSYITEVAEERVEYRVAGGVPKDEIARLVKDLESQMKQAAKNLEFERAALLRDQIIELRKELISGEDALHEFAKSAYGAAETGRQKSAPGDSWRTRPQPEGTGGGSRKSGAKPCSQGAALGSVAADLRSAGGGQ
jgi:hypothetical protein